MPTRLTRTLALLLLSSVLASCSAPPRILGELDLRLNPSGRTPLAGSLSFATDQPARATLVISDGEHTMTVTPSEDYDTEHELMVLGLRPGRANSIAVRLENRRGQEGPPATLQVEMPPLPQGLPPVEVTLSFCLGSLHWSSHFCNRSATCEGAKKILQCVHILLPSSISEARERD